MRTLGSIEKVIEELGGTKAVAELTKRTGSISTVPNWIKRKRLPSTTYKIMKTALEEKGATAPDEFWGMS